MSLFFIWCPSTMMYLTYCGRNEVTVYIAICLSHWGMANTLNVECCRLWHEFSVSDSCFPENGCHNLSSIVTLNFLAVRNAECFHYILALILFYVVHQCSTWDIANSTLKKLCQCAWGFCSKIMIFQWIEWATFDVVISSHLIFVM